MNRKKGFKIFMTMVVMVVFIMDIFILRNLAEGAVIYNYSAEKILSEYRDEGRSMGYAASILDEKELDARAFLLCGNHFICDMTVLQEDTIELSCKRRWGKAKLLLENQESGKVSVTDIEDIEKGTTEINMEKGTYKIYLTGKWFGGKVSLKSDDILLEMK